PAGRTAAGDTGTGDAGTAGVLHRGGGGLHEQKRSALAPPRRRRRATRATTITPTTRRARARMTPTWREPAANHNPSPGSVKRRVFDRREPGWRLCGSGVRRETILSE